MNSCRERVKVKTTDAIIARRISLAPQAQTAILAANTYRALMIGEGSAVESGAVNIWQEQKYVVPAMREYLKHFEHPVFMRQLREDGDVSLLYTPGTMVSGRELPMHLGLPTRSVHGMAVIEHAEFGRNVPIVSADKKEQLALGCIYHMEMRKKKIRSFYRSRHCGRILSSQALPARVNPMRSISYWQK